MVAPYIPAPIISPDTRKHSPWGIASFIIALVAALIICVDFVPAFGITRSITVSQIYAWIDNTLTCNSTLLVLVGFGLGIASLFQKNAKNVFGILGLLFTSLIMPGLCVTTLMTMATD